jgi:hypothetical protein
MTVGLDWPGRREVLTDREAEILALMTQGKTTPRSPRHFPQPEHRQVLHPQYLLRDPSDQPHPGRPLGRQERIQRGPPPHRPLARRPPRR